MKHFFGLLALTPLLLITSLTTSAQSAIVINGDQYLENLFDASLLFDTISLAGEQATARQAGMTIKEPAVAVTDSSNAWRNWRTVDNFFYGKNRGSLPMIADIHALHPYFRDRVAELIIACKAAGIDLAIVESYRTPAKQAEYYTMGKKYTSTPGGKSRHQYGLAVDVVPIVDSIAVWDNHKLWRKIGLAGERLGLRWGGRWRVTYDPGHFEWSGGLSRYELAKGLLPRIPSSLSGQYPTLSQELNLLQAYWGAWEVEQSVIANSALLKPSDEELPTGVGN